MKIGRLLDNIKKHEGIVKTAGRHMMYKDSVGKITIAHGRNLTDRGLSDSEAMFLLNNDVQETVDELRNKYWWFDELDDVRQEVVINMAFNMGVPVFSTFRNTIAYIGQGDYLQASRNMLQSLWASQVGIRAQGLAREMASGEPDEEV